MSSPEMGSERKSGKRRPNFRCIVRALRLIEEGKVCYACGQKLPAAPPEKEKP